MYGSCVGVTLAGVHPDRRPLAADDRPGPQVPRVVLGEAIAQVVRLRPLGGNVRSEQVGQPGDLTVVSGRLR